MHLYKATIRILVIAENEEDADAVFREEMGDVRINPTFEKVADTHRVGIADTDASIGGEPVFRYTTRSAKHWVNDLGRCVADVSSPP